MIPINNDLSHIVQHIAALCDLPEPATLKRLIDAIYVKDNPDATAQNIDKLTQILEENPEWGAGLATFVLRLTNQYRQITLYTDTGIASDENFWHNFKRLIGHRFLPLLPEEDSVVELVAFLFDQSEDDWLEQIDDERLFKLVTLIGNQSNHLELVANAKNNILNAIVILSYRISGMGLHPDLMNAYPQLLNYSEAFVAQNQEAVLFANEYRRLHELDTLTDVVPEIDIDPAPLLVMIEQCDEIVINIRKRIYKTGISIRMTNMLVRLEQSLRRMKNLISLLSDDDVKQNNALVLLLRAISNTAKSRYSFGYLVESNTKLLSRKVTENASRVGEHYISTDATGYRKMYKKAAIGGFIIAFMATMKTLAYHLALAPVGRAFVNSMIYGLGFVSIHIVKGTVATKQPAMTAAAIASTISDGAGKKTQQLTKLSELVVDILRTQFIAILGNISVAMPVAFLIAYVVSELYGVPMVDSTMAAHLLHDLNPFTSLALPHAAIAGVFLFLSGLITGYYDNLAAYNKIGERLRRHGLLIKALPQKWLATGSEFIENNLGAIMGNFIFGCFLGSTATVGYMLGLPLDIRHIAFASANFVHGMYFLSPLDVSWQIGLISFLGVLLIGFVNLFVSFSLALIVALRAKNVAVFEWRRLGKMVFAHFLKRPQDFIIPRRKSVQYLHLDSEGQIIPEDIKENKKEESGRYAVRLLSRKKKVSDDTPKTDIREAIAAHHNDELTGNDKVEQNINTNTNADNQDVQNALTPLPKPDKPPQLPK